MAVGCSLNLLMEYKFYFFYIGQFITTIGVSFFTILSPAVCDNWFGSKERPLALAVAIILSEISNIFSLAIPVVFIGNEKGAPKEEIFQGKQHFDYYRIGLSLFFFFVILIFFKEKPKVQANAENTER